MTHVFKRSLGAATALSAVLALGSTPAFAQEAVPLDSPESITAPAAASPAAAPSAPTVTLPTAPTTTNTPAASNAPTIVLPPVSTVPAPAPAPAAAEPEAAPAATAAPERRAPAAAAPAARTNTSSTAPRAAAPAAPANAPIAAEAPASGEMMPAPMLPADTVIDATPEAAMEPVAPAAKPATSAEPATDGNMALAGLVGLLALVALGGAGFMLMRRRKPVDEAEPEMVLTRAQAVEPAAAAPEAMEPAHPVHVPPAMPVTPARVTDAPAYRAPQPAVARAPRPVPLDANGKPVSPFVYNRTYNGLPPEERPVFVMPAGPVPTGEARTALLREMVASRPDAANPFTSPKWRMRRARTLLVRREKGLGDQTSRPFDFRDFSTHVPIKPYRPAKTPEPQMA